MNFFGNQDLDLPAIARNLIRDNGGFAGLKDKLESAGLGEALGTWIGSGDNEAVDGDRLADALGRDQLEGLAAKTGLDLGKIIPLVAAFLPQIVDKLTPDGDESGAEDRLEDEGGLNDLLGDVLRGGLGKLFG